jgi:hypothetical protein
MESLFDQASSYCDLSVTLWRRRVEARGTVRIVAVNEEIVQVHQSLQVKCCRIYLDE